MRTAGTLMTREVITLAEGDLLDDADAYVELANIRHLPVVNAGRLVGLVTHRDLLRHCRRKDAKTGTPIRVSEVMTRDVTTVSPGTSLREALRVMLENKYGCLPVVDSSGLLRGIITEHDLLRFADEYIQSLDRRELADEYNIGG